MPSNPLRWIPLPPWPWKNMTTWRLMVWKMTGSFGKSMAEVNRLIHDIILAKDFNADDLHDVNILVEQNRFDKSESDLHPDFQLDGWRETNVEICIPFGGQSTEPNTFTVPSVLYQPLVPVIRAAFLKLQQMVSPCAL